jgi:hypothetical protein
MEYFSQYRSGDTAVVKLLKDILTTPDSQLSVGQAIRQKAPDKVRQKAPDKVRQKAPDKLNSFVLHLLSRWILLLPLF